MDKDISKIKAFWDARAKEYGDNWRATLGERYLRMLEIKIMKRYIRNLNPKLVYDIGCGNGYSTLAYAKQFPDIQLVGVDYSEEMIKIASKKEISNCKFIVGDILKPESLPSDEADLIITQRCIQNLPDYASQKLTIINLTTKLSTDGILLMMECSKDGVHQLNKMRKLFLKKPIENIEPWHNTFFVDQRIIDDFSAKVVYFSSTYMFVSKVVSSRLSWLGYLLPNIAKFGYDRLYIITRLV